MYDQIEYRGTAGILFSKPANFRDRIDNWHKKMSIQASWQYQEVKACGCVALPLSLAKFAGRCLQTVTRCSTRKSNVAVSQSVERLAAQLV